MYINLAFPNSKQLPSAASLTSIPPGVRRPARTQRLANHLEFQTDAALASHLSSDAPVSFLLPHLRASFCAESTPLAALGCLPQGDDSRERSKHKAARLGCWRHLEARHLTCLGQPSRDLNLHEARSHTGHFARPPPDPPGPGSGAAAPPISPGVGVLRAPRSPKAAGQ